MEDFMICRKTTCISLANLIADGLRVSELSINGILFGDANSNAKLELSTDRQMLFIYTEDGYISVAKTPINNIQMVKFMINDDEFEIYP